MAWTTPRTWVTGEIVTAAIMNQQVRDNESALLGYFDDVSQDQPTRALDTVYQNTSSKIRIVTVCCILAEDDQVNVYCDENASPTTLLGGIENEASATADLAITFVVKPNYYYKATSFAGSPSIRKWTEWDWH